MLLAYWLTDAAEIYPWGMEILTFLKPCYYHYYLKQFDCIMLKVLLLCRNRSFPRRHVNQGHDSWFLQGDWFHMVYFHFLWQSPFCVRMIFLHTRSPVSPVFTGTSRLRTEPEPRVLQQVMSGVCVRTSVERVTVTTFDLLSDQCETSSHRRIFGGPSPSSQGIVGMMATIVDRSVWLVERIDHWQPGGGSTK